LTDPHHFAILNNISNNRNAAISRMVRINKQADFTDKQKPITL